MSFARGGLLLDFAGLAACMFLKNPVLMMVVIILAQMAPTFWTLPMAMLSGAAAVSIVLINAVANLGGFLGPDLVGRSRSRPAALASGRSPASCSSHSARSPSGGSPGRKSGRLRRNGVRRARVRQKRLPPLRLEQSIEPGSFAVRVVSRLSVGPQGGLLRLVARQSRRSTIWSLSAAAP
jgi:hypothetical protein